MSDEKTPAQVADDVVVSMDYTLTVDGEVLDSSAEEGPLDYLQGHGNIIRGLEREMTGMKVGDSKSVKVQAADGYGETDPEAVMDVPMSEFPDDVPVKVGVELHLRDKDGDEIFAKILEVRKDSVKLDTNHPLAGKELHFEVKVVGLRAATAEELSHGHVHSHGHGH